jgi:hypothetical protein
MFPNCFKIDSSPLRKLNAMVQWFSLRGYFRKLYKTLSSEVVFRTETELKIRNEIERKIQDIQPNGEKEKWLSVWGFELTLTEAQLFESLSDLATTLLKR